MASKETNIDAMSLFPSVEELLTSYTSQDALIAITKILEAARGALDEIGTRVDPTDEELRIKIGALSEMLATQATKTLEAID